MPFDDLDQNTQRGLVDIALSMYSGRPCAICGEVIESMEDLRDTVAASDGAKTIAHGRCWRGRGVTQPVTEEG